MNVKHMRPKKQGGWDQLEVTAEPGRRLWIDNQVIGPHRILILEGPEEEKQPECPRCGNPGAHDTAVRSGKLGDIGIADVGWRCRKCGHEWGFEYFHDKEGPRGDQSTRGNLPREP